jgi:Txe/YoeB family toxin of Txe-Axe toxin-antitoxin module
MVTTTYTNVRANLARYLDQVTDWAKIDRKTALRTFKLIEAIMRDPFAGLGKLVPQLSNFEG